MIVKLQEDSMEKVMKYVKKQPALNLFIIGDLENFGFTHDFQELWGDLDEEGNLQGVLLRYRNSFIPYSEGEHDIAGFAKIIETFDGPLAFSGCEEVIERYEPFIGHLMGRKTRTYFCQCTKDSFVPCHDGKVEIQRADLGMIDDVTDLLETIEEFSLRPDIRESNRHRIESGTGRTYFIAENGKPISSASTTAENTNSAMVMAVCTANEARGKGYASRIVSKLASDLLKEGRVPCLFYDNPVAGKIYKAIGFRDIGKWTMYR
ncbi:GNAT family N-acetyltransferase [Bacillus testis]|uniref:GNAT family N-acetyltransferase n=1 Tax=Bacillus testis TaxID=1622072 RepID=UPI00084109DA|nr:GNAT family N-acetyltransferase [Bacillus testis]